jgi:ribonucleoside-diphosphate reductase alpha chain
MLKTKTRKYEELSEFARTIYEQKYAMQDEDGNLIEDWPDTVERVVSNVLGALGYGPDSEEYQKLYQIVLDRKFIPGGRYLYSTGRPLHQVNNCFMVKVDDNREGWAELGKKAFLILQTGGGLGVEYSDVRGYGSPIKKTGGIASGPLPLMQSINEIGRAVIQGGFRRSALIALLDWNHSDIEGFIHSKDWPEEIVQLKEKDFNAFAPMDRTNISVNLDDEFFDAYHDPSHPEHSNAHIIYDDAIRNAVTTGEPGFSVNVDGYSTEKLRNPCGEIVSSDDSDVCNLGSINLAKIEDIVEMEEVVNLATLFLLAGTVYSDIPYEKVDEIRSKNRRLGLGLMGVHEWLLKRGYRYEPTDELAEWLDVYAGSWEPAQRYAQKHSLTPPIATRAIAPAGSIGIIGETTTGCEPIFCVAYKRRYLSDGEGWKYQYVIDPTAHRLIKEGVDPSDIEDAYSLSYDVERRIKFQEFLQGYVDQGVSSTINLPGPITDEDDVQFVKDILIDSLPKLRGVTFYPDGARGGQPLVPSTYDEAIKHVGVVFEEDEEVSCRNGVCGT